MQQIVTLDRIKQRVISEIIIPQGTTANIFNFKDEPRLRNEKVKRIYAVPQLFMFQYNKRQLLNGFEMSLCRVTISNNENKKILDDVPLLTLGDLPNVGGNGNILLLQTIEPQVIDLSKSQLVIDDINFIFTGQTRSVIFLFDLA